MDTLSTRTQALQLSGELSGKRMLVVEEALKSESGHWFEYVKSVVDLNREAGAESAVVVHSTANQHVRTSLNAHAIFQWTNWDNIYAHPQAWRRYLGIAIHNWRVYRTMRRFIRKHGPFDILFAPTVVIHHVIGWRLLMLTEKQRIGRIILLLRNNAGSYPANSSVPVFKRSTAILKWALKSFSGLIGRGRARLVTDSEKLAAEYKHLSGLELSVLPSPRTAPPAPLRERVWERHDPVVFSCLGPARFEKGIDVMQDAIRRFLTAEPDANARFIIQWNEPVRTSDGSLYEPDAELEADPRVKFLKQTLSSEDYGAAIYETDCMLLPYRRDSYFARISGVAVEAATAGIPLIYTQDTWCEDLVRDCGAGIGVPDGDVSELARAISDMTAHFDEYLARARARADQARESHSPRVFIDRLWAER